MKISLSEAAGLLEHLCDNIANSDQVDHTLELFFKTYMNNLSESVDRRISYIKYAESQIKMATEMRDSWDARIKRFNAVIERIKVNTIETMKGNPSIPYKGSFGSLSIRRNAQPSLVIQSEKELFYQKEFIIEKREINRAALKTSLLAGTNIPGASLEYGEHLRIQIK